jgi:DNA repair exonuclease SbcCD ATPase subunit
MHDKIQSPPRAASLSNSQTSSSKSGSTPLLANTGSTPQVSYTGTTRSNNLVQSPHATEIEVARLQLVNRGLQLNLTQSQKECETLRQQYEVLKAAASDQHQRFVAQLDALSEELRATSLRATDSETKNNDLNAQLKDSQQSLRDLTHQLHVKEIEVSNLTNSLQESREQLHMMMTASNNRSMDELEREFEKLRQQHSIELADAKAQLIRERQQHQSVVAAQMESHQSILAELQAMIQTKDELLEALQAKCDELHSTLTDATHHQADDSDLSTLLDIAPRDEARTDHGPTSDHSQIYTQETSNTSDENSQLVLQLQDQLQQYAQREQELVVYAQDLQQQHASLVDQYNSLQRRNQELETFKHESQPAHDAVLQFMQDLPQV